MKKFVVLKICSVIFISVELIKCSRPKQSRVKDTFPPIADILFQRSNTVSAREEERGSQHKQIEQLNLGFGGL